MWHTPTHTHSFLHRQRPYPRKRHRINITNVPNVVSIMHLSHSNMLHALPEAALHHLAMVLVQFLHTNFLLLRKHTATSLNLNMWWCFNQPLGPTFHIARYMAEWMRTTQSLHIHYCGRNMVLTVRFNIWTYHIYWQWRKDYFSWQPCVTNVRADKDLAWRKNSIQDYRRI